MGGSESSALPVLAEKAYGSEKYIAPIRVAVVLSAIVTYPFVRDETADPRPAAACLALCLVYSTFVLLRRPFQKASVGWAYGLSAVDTVLTLAWLFVSGGIDSPYFGALYACGLAIALRQGFGATMGGAVVLAVGYLGVLALRGELHATLTLTLVRLIYLLFVGLAGALFSNQVVGTSLRLARANERLRSEIAERRRAERKLRVQARELTRSNKQLENFAYMASHDLQEPLRMVTNYCLLLERRYKGKLGAEGMEFVRFAVEGATRMKDFIDAILAFSRVQSETWAFSPQRLDDVLCRALEDLARRIGETRAHITYEPLPVVRGNGALLAHVFQNLVSNGIKFNRSGSPRVHVSATRQGDHCTISVRDNGIGIDEKYREKLFALFRRLHPRHEFEGTGLGLAICKEIVEKHHGRLWFESVPGQGTTFHFTLEAVGDPARAPLPADTAEPRYRGSPASPSVSA